MVSSNPITLEAEDHSRDAAFKKAMHGNTATSKVGFSAMLSKDKEGHKAAVDEYFKHWDNKGNTEEESAVSPGCLEPHSCLPDNCSRSALPSMPP